jgi:hypothetical protein
VLEDLERSPDVLLRTVIQQLIMHELDVITESDWFRELVEESVKKIIEEKKEVNDEDNQAHERSI